MWHVNNPFKKATEEDTDMQKLIRYLNKGWPHTKKAVEPGVENLDQ